MQEAWNLELPSELAVNLRKGLWTESCMPMIDKETALVWIMLEVIVGNIYKLLRH